MENYFEKLEKLQEEIKQSNLSEESKQAVITALREHYFEKAREQGIIIQNVEFFQQGFKK